MAKETLHTPYGTNCKIEQTGRYYRVEQHYADERDEMKNISTLTYSNKKTEPKISLKESFWLIGPLLLLGAIALAIILFT